MSTAEKTRAELTISFAGLYNIIFLLPAFPLLHYSGIESFEFPPTSAAWTIIGINMLITLSSDYLYVLAMLKTTPLREFTAKPIAYWR